MSKKPVEDIIRKKKLKIVLLKLLFISNILVD